jgi:hypothetical protein
VARFAATRFFQEAVIGPASIPETRRPLNSKPITNRFSGFSMIVAQLKLNAKREQASQSSITGIEKSGPQSALCRSPLADTGEHAPTRGTINQKFFVHGMLTSDVTLKIFVRLKIEDREESVTTFLHGGRTSYVACCIRRTAVASNAECLLPSDSHAPRRFVMIQ